MIQIAFSLSCLRTFSISQRRICFLRHPILFLSLSLSTHHLYVDMLRQMEDGCYKSMQWPIKQTSWRRLNFQYDDDSPRRNGRSAHLLSPLQDTVKMLKHSDHKITFLSKQNKLEASGVNGSAWLNNDPGTQKTIS